MTQTNAQNAQAQNAPTHSRALTQEQAIQAIIDQLEHETQNYHIAPFTQWGQAETNPANGPLVREYAAKERQRAEKLLLWEDSAAGEKTK